jgi:hypothetical protein
LFPQYQLDKSSYSTADGRFTAKVLSPSGSQPLNLGVSFYGSGSVRVKLSENEPRWQVLSVSFLFPPLLYLTLVYIFSLETF